MNLNSYARKTEILYKTRKVAKEKGINYVIRAAIKRITNQLVNSPGYYYYRIFKSQGRFVFQGEIYRYFYHRYNTTWRNERAVEIPILFEIVKKSKGKSILEVGNVLSHYFSVNYEIVDKYEKAKDVINQDVVDFHPSQKYDLIVCISTLEHVGWDENLSEHKILHSPMKILHAIENMEKALAPQGKIVITLPLGYNPELDNLCSNNQIQFTTRYYMKRISKDNRWIEVDWESARRSKYNNPFPAANGLLIGIIQNR